MRNKIFERLNRKTLFAIIAVAICLSVAAVSYGQALIYRQPAPTENMVRIPAGEFRMGSNDKEASRDEAPVHTVYVDAFYIDKYEVTNAQYKKFVDANPAWRKDRIPAQYHAGGYLQDWTGNNYPRGKDNHPVVYVSWYAAMAYAKWAGNRLPTEAEWEKAARGGLVGKKYPWGNSTYFVEANYEGGLEGRGTTPVGDYSPNGYGLYDMAGNVEEWCLDAYEPNFYARSPHANPIAGGNSIKQLLDNYTGIKANRVLRGGAWDDGARYVRVAKRRNQTPVTTYSEYGFRCAKSVTP